MVKEADRAFLVPVEEVTRIVAKGNYAEVHTRGGSHLIREIKGQLERRLDPERFARIHRSEIVNVDSVAEIQPWSHGTGWLSIKDGSQTRMSRRFSDRLLKGL